MIDLSAFYAARPYAWAHEEKAARLLEALNQLQVHHLAACEPYRKLARLQGGDPPLAAVENFPLCPVGLFKRYELTSVPRDNIVKVMTSSGTSGQSVSRVPLDKETSLAQTRALACIMKDFIGPRRMPMIIIDAKMALKDPKLFSARGAGILGISFFGREPFYALNDDYTLNVDGLLAFAEKHRTEPVLLFGFTYMVWQYFAEELRRRQVSLDLGHSFLLHVGGWKKLKELAVSNAIFKERLAAVCGKVSIHNFYGMAEQTGSIYMECGQGHLHASNFSQIVVRDPLTFAALPFRTKGIVQTVSVLPWSYPGHVLLTEDVGEILGEDDCPCGRMGRYFALHGRLPRAEARGCSDVYAMAR